MDVLKPGFVCVLPRWPPLFPPVSDTISAVSSSHRCLQSLLIPLTLLVLPQVLQHLQLQPQQPAQQGAAFPAAGSTPYTQVSATDGMLTTHAAAFPSVGALIISLHIQKYNCL